MDFKLAKQYLLSKPEALEDYPFDNETLVLKIRHKMFATLVEKDSIAHMNLKCDPDEAFALRDLFKSVIPGYHMNKKHWNTIILDDSIPVGEIERMIDNSYSLVVKSFTKAIRLSLELSHGSEKVYR